MDEYNNEVLCRLTPLQQKEVGIPAFYIRPVVPRLKSSDENEARLSEMAHLEDELYKAEEEAGIPHQKQNFVVRALQKYVDWKENRPRHKVDKRIYVLLLFFWAGAVHTAFWSTAGSWACSICLSAGRVSALHSLWLTS